MTTNEFFVKTKTILGKGAKKAAKVSSDAFDYTKLKIKLNAVEVELEEMYAKIGRIVYEHDETQDTDAICAEIEKLNEKKEELKSKLNLYSGKKVCEFCGNKIAADSNFCSVCGREAE